VPRLSEYRNDRRRNAMPLGRISLGASRHCAISAALGLKPRYVQNALNWAAACANSCCSLAWFSGGNWSYPYY
jgi:hypothetical protein